MVLLDVNVLVADAWHAALAIEHGCEWISDDADFARFPDCAGAAQADTDATAPLAQSAHPRG
jgi:hypothetical protein